MNQNSEVYRGCTHYTTLSPCPICTGAVLLYGIPRVVIGENATFKGAEDSLLAAGVEVLQDLERWNEDIGR